MEGKVRVSSLDIMFEMSIRYTSRVGRGYRGIDEAGVQGREPSWKYTFRMSQHIADISSCETG